MKCYQFEIFSRLTVRGRRHFFRMRAPNGEVVLQSQAYKHWRSAHDAVQVIRVEANNASVEVLP